MLKKQYHLIVVLMLSMIGMQSWAGTRYWKGNGGNWNSTSNWSSTLLGVTGASVPGSNDTVYFDTCGTGCNINANVNVKRVESTAYFADTVKQNTFAITIGGQLIWSTGFFWGGSGTITLGGTFTQSGGTFRSSSGDLFSTGNFTHSGGTFLHNNGNVRFSAMAPTINGSTDFYDLQFHGNSLGSEFTLDGSSTFNVANELLQSGSTAVKLTGGTIHAKGSISQTNTYTNNGIGTATIVIDGTGTQYFNGRTNLIQWSVGWLCNIKINKSGSDTLYLKDAIGVGGKWEYVSGIVDASTYSSIVGFPYGGSGGLAQVIGSQTLNKVKIGTFGGVSNAFSVNSGYTLTVTDSLVISGNGPVSIDGNISLKGSLIAHSSSTSAAGGGLGTITFNGTGTQYIDGSDDMLEGWICNIVINKSSGTLYLKDFITLDQDLTYTAGTIDATTNSSTIVLPANSSRVISGSFTVDDLTIYAAGTSANSFGATDTVTVNGELRIQGGNTAEINNGTVRVLGDIILSNTTTASGGSGHIYINGTGAQLFDGTTTGLQGELCNVHINKPSGTLIYKDFIGTIASWRYTAGTIDVSTYSSTVVFPTGTKQIYGSQPFNNLTFSASGASSTNSINSGDTLTVNGTLKLEGGSGIAINNGAIKALGDISITNTWTSATSATGTIVICGTGTQTLTGSGISLAGRLCPIKIDKASGALILASIITGQISWEFIRGSVNPGTSTVVTSGAAFTLDGQGASSTMRFNNVTAGSTATTLGGNLTAFGAITINSSATLNGNGKNLNVSGNWTNSGAFTHAATKVTFDGAANQYLSQTSGTMTFDSVVVNKLTGKVMLSKPMAVNKKLTLTEGVIASTTTNLLSMPDNGIITAGSDSSYVCGPMKKTGNDVFTFPLGDTVLTTGAYHPLAITAPTVVTDVFTGQYFATGQTLGDSLEVANIDSVSGCEHWILTRNTGSSVVKPSLGWNSNSCNVTTIPLLVAGWNGTNWASLGRAGYSLAGSTFSVNALNGLSSASLALVIANKNGPLDMAWGSVDANCATAVKGKTRVKVFGGTPPYTYLWNTGQTIAELSNINAGVYYLKVTDAVDSLLEEQFRVYTCNEWIDLNGVTVSGEAVTKTAVNGYGNASAKSKNLLYELTEGALKYTVEDLTKSFIAGFSTESKTDDLYANTRFAFGVNTSTLTLYINGTLTNTFTGGLASGDIVELHRTPDSVRLFKNGTVLVRTASANAAELKTDFIPSTQNSTVTNLRATFEKPQLYLNTRLMRDTIAGTDSTVVAIWLDSAYVMTDTTGVIDSLDLSSAFSAASDFEFFFSKSGLNTTKIKCTVSKYGSVSAVYFHNDTTYVLLDSSFFAVRNKRELVPIPVNSSLDELIELPVSLVLEGGIVLSPNGDSLYDYLSVTGVEEVSSFQFEVYDLSNELIYQTTQKDFQWDGRDPSLILTKGTYNYEMTLDGNILTGTFLIDF